MHDLPFSFVIHFGLIEPSALSFLDAVVYVPPFHEWFAPLNATTTITRKSKMGEWPGNNSND